MSKNIKGVIIILLLFQVLVYSTALLEELLSSIQLCCPQLHLNRILEHLLPSIMLNSENAFSYEWLF